MEKTEQIEEILSNRYKTEYQIYSAFYNLCCSDGKSLVIKKLFLKLDYRDKLSDSVLTYGLIGALRYSNMDYFDTIFKFMERNNIKPKVDALIDALVFDTKPISDEIGSEIASEKIMYLLEKCDVDLNNNNLLEIVFNYSTFIGDDVLINKLNEKYNILQNALINKMDKNIKLSDGASSSWANLKEDGSLVISGSMGSPCFNNEMAKGFYKQNPILFNLQNNPNNENYEILNSFLKNDYKIHSSIIEYALVQSIYLNDKKAVRYLLKNEKCANIIRNSNKMKNFINSNNDFAEHKKEARIILSALELEYKLPNKSSTKNKVKI